MKRLLFLPVVLISIHSSNVLADITVSGDVWGLWPAGEIVTVIDHIRVPLGQTLIIEPGVQVLFEGRYKFTVEGKIEAVGTEFDMILFTRKYPTELSKWRGFRFDGADNDSILEHCRLEWAKGEGAYPDVRGGAVWVSNCSPTFRRCIFNDNYSHNGNYNGTGGAISLEQNCFSLIEFNLMYNNQADSGGAIMVGSECDPVISHNAIENNQAFYAGGGIYVAANAESTIHGNVIQGNTSGGWGGGGINLWSSTLLYGTYSHVYNNLIVGNKATSSGSAKGGGGIYSRYEASLIYNNTVAGNQASQGGGMYVLTYFHVPPVVFNCIFWDDTAGVGPEIYADPSTGSAVQVSYCDVKGGHPGVGNINSNPLFVNTAAGDYHLMYGSPCIDTGDNSAVYIPLEDHEGDPRQANGHVDMGADEFFNHLYITGDTTPGGAVELKHIGWPGTNPIGLWISGGLMDPPITSPFGDWFLAFPVIGPVDLGVMPPGGIIILGGTIPASVPPPYNLYLQSLMGKKFTNLCILPVR